MTAASSRCASRRAGIDLRPHPAGALRVNGPAPVTERGLFFLGPAKRVSARAAQRHHELL